MLYLSKQILIRKSRVDFVLGFDLESVVSIIMSYMWSSYNILWPGKFTSMLEGMDLKYITCYFRKPSWIIRLKTKCSPLMGKGYI